MRLIFLTCVCGLIAVSCSERQDNGGKTALYTLLDPEKTKIHFVNQLEYTEAVNTYTFKNFYNGGGVALADFDNDSLTDIFFAGNLVSNKLYRNTGDFTFQDVTQLAGLESSGTWSTGVSVVDINSDGWLDIYVCKSGPPGGERRNNELFINNGDLTFEEKSKEYGLDFTGLSTHAVFFDYDKDGDLDCYILNNSIRPIGGYDLRKDQRRIPDPQGGNKLLRNDESRFVDVSSQSGIYTSMIGFGLGVNISDINKDGWPDIYVSNDFFEKDYLYINRKDGTFSESLEEHLGEISLGSMGADMADINNDALPEIFVTEMLPEADDRLKTTTQFENWDKYVTSVEQGYYHQFSRNVLQLNNGDDTFSEISRFAGVHASDWSWGALIFDMDNDGNKDIFVANGIYKDLLDQDYVNFVSDRNTVRGILDRRGAVIKQLIDSIPVNKISNFAFRNSGKLVFSNMASQWGLDEPTHSNGSAYGDLDNDGDLDLVLNNVNMPAHLYENHVRRQRRENNYLSVMLYGTGKNTFALGTKVTLKAGDQLFYQEHFPMRGFMSSVDYKLNFGLGGVTSIDSLIVQWPDDKVTIKTNVRANQLLHLLQKDASDLPTSRSNVPGPSTLSAIKMPGADFKHSENSFVDFDRDRLLFNMVSNEGPCLCVGDVNDDGLQDFYIGGAKNQSGSLFVQRKSGDFIKTNDKLFEADSASEDTDCVFFDSNNDGTQDLYVASGGNEFSSSSPALLDRLYFNSGYGVFSKSNQLFPAPLRFESTATVEPFDYDHDGDQDLFVGVRLIPGLYGVPCNGYLLTNDGKGNFQDQTAAVAPGLQNVGMIRDAAWADIDNDSFTDLIVVGDWMAIRIFLNRNGKFVEQNGAGLEKSNGWYNTVETADFNGDGWMDLVVGNHGLNSRFKASQTEPLNLYINDFDQNGSVEHITTRFYEGKSLPLVLRQDLVMQIPSLKKKYLHFENYKGQTITDIFTPSQLEKAITLTTFNLETMLLMNNRYGSFTRRVLPVQAQFSPVYAILIDDIDRDSNADILLGGNLYRAKPETGIYDGSYGLLLRGDGRGNFTAVPPKRSGIRIKGEIRGLKKISCKKETVMVARNNDELQFFSY
jgi:hypothetical protein